MIDWQTPLALVIVAGTAGFAARRPLASLLSGRRRPDAPAAGGCGGCASNGACGQQRFEGGAARPGCH